MLFLAYKYRFKNVKGGLLIFSQKMLKANQTLKFQGHRINKHDFLHGEIDWRKIKVDLKIFELVRLERL